MINLKVEEAEVPVSEQTLKELLNSINEMKKKGIKKCRVSSPYSKTSFVLSTSENSEKSLNYKLGLNIHEDHA